jgi:hypothetical protein
MEGLPAIVVALVIGVFIGYGVALVMRRKQEAGQREGGGKTVAEPDWWEIRKVLTGTQLQILQHMETKRAATIKELQEKFSFIPDRELFYRLEQILLLGFLIRDRKEGEVIYSLNASYSGTVEGDKTVMLSE